MMRKAASISLFLGCNMVCLCLGVFVGVKTTSFFYPHEYETQSGNRIAREEVTQVVKTEEKLNADTKYVLKENDVIQNTSFATTTSLPPKYFGMTREQFVDAMRRYENAPPLSELQRGFVGLQVLSFSKDQVVVRMDYRYVQAGASFYLAAIDHEVVVLLEDKKTVYMDTGISLDTLPVSLQQQIMDMLYMENKEALVNFLENYTS